MSRQLLNLNKSNDLCLQKSLFRDHGHHFETALRVNFIADDLSALQMTWNISEQDSVGGYCT